METTNEAAARLLALIEKARSNPIYRTMPGLSGVLDALDTYVEAQELRWSAVNANLQGIARVILEKHFGRNAMTTDELNALARLANNVATIEPAELAARTHGHG